MDFKVSRREFVSTLTGGVAFISAAPSVGNVLKREGETKMRELTGKTLDDARKGDKKMILHVLSTGSPDPARERFGTSFVLQLAGDYLMFDCGPAATHKLAKVGIHPKQVNYLFFTHHHFDHNVDYPCFLLSRWDQGASRIKRLQVWGPPPTAWITERLVGPDGAFSHDWKARVGHPVSQFIHKSRGGSLPRPEPSFDVKDVEPGEVVDHDYWKVTAALAKHVEPWLTSLAYRVDSDAGSIVFAGDTAPCESVEKLARDADILVISCVYHQDAGKRVYVICGTLDTAHMAVDCGIKKLILVHTGAGFAGPGSREKAVGDIARIYPGEIFFADELMRLTLRRPR